MEEVMDSIPAKAFTLQTNGTHLTEISEDQLHKLHSILVSIGEPREVTDGNRGPEAYEEVLRNVREIRSRGHQFRDHDQRSHRCLPHCAGARVQPFIGHQLGESDGVEGFYGSGPARIATFSVCGGRCLFVNKTKFWGDEMFGLVCHTTKSMIRGLEGIAPTVNTLIE